MGLFSKIADRIFNRKAEPAAAPRPATSASTSTHKPIVFTGNENDPKVSPPPLSPAPAAAAEPVDVDAVLTQMAQAKGGDSNWRTSIVDLLKLLDLDSDLAARKELAAELDVNAGAHGSAEQNIALHKAVMRKLAENGGKVPADLRD